MAELSTADILQQYGDTVILYKGTPCKVKQVGVQVKLLNLRTQRNSLVDFSLKDFAPPVLRLGYVNIDDISIFVARKPVRKFQTGISRNNCSFTLNRKAPSLVDSYIILKKVEAMECPEFADMMLGHYPSLKDAIKHAKEFQGSVAFDKQFSVDYYKCIFYKGIPVGYCREKKIEFNPKFEHLSLLLGNEYEKAVRTFAKETN